MEVELWKRRIIVWNSFTQEEMVCAIFIHGLTTCATLCDLGALEELCNESEMFAFSAVSFKSSMHPAHKWTANDRSYIWVSYGMRRERLVTR